jgi:hypothetical protein
MISPLQQLKAFDGYWVKITKKYNAVLNSYPTIKIEAFGRTGNLELVIERELDENDSVVSNLDENGNSYVEMTLTLKRNGEPIFVLYPTADLTGQNSFQLVSGNTEYTVSTDLWDQVLKDTVEIANFLNYTNK